MLIYINGISSTGKSFLGEELVKCLCNSVTIDQDLYYKKIKPTVTFTDDKGKEYKASNWDCNLSIDNDAFVNDIKYLLTKYTYVIVTGFALRSDELNLEPDLSILLLHDKNSIEHVIKSRRISKRLSVEQYDKDEWMVRKVVWPFYKETLTKLYPYHIIYVYNDNKRVDKQILINQILKLI